MGIAVSYAIANLAVLDSKGATKISLPYLMQTFRLTNPYLRNGSNLLKVAGNEPTISATAPRTTATIAVSTKRSFHVFHLKVTISGVVHSVRYEITFFAVNPAPIATSPITKIHLDLSPESSLFIKLTC